MQKINISGPMAVGKTTLIRELVKEVPKSSAIYEDAAKVNMLFKTLSNGSPMFFARDLKQMLFLNDLLGKFDRTESEVVFIDKGVEDYIFFWLRSYELMDNPPSDFKLIIQHVFKNLSNIHSDKIIYLTAPDEVLVARKRIDSTRSRGFFEEFMQRFRTRELEFFQKQGAEIVDTSNLGVKDLVELVRIRLGL